MNILLTSAGRRTYMVDYFREALNGEGLVFASNSQMSPALQNADEAFLSPLIFSDDYIPFLLKICREKKVGLVVSLFDIDLPVLAEHRAEFEAIGVTLAVSESETLKHCNDKFDMYRTLKAAGIPTPETTVSAADALKALDAGSMHWPIIVKPRFGMGSIGILKAYTKEELAACHSMCGRAIKNSYLKYESAQEADCVLLQEVKDGQEYGLDVICDLKGSYQTTIVRKKAAMRSGETDEAIVLGSGDAAYDILCALGAKLASVFRPYGNLDVDVLMDTAERVPYVIDMNARFGGGYPFSHLAGANLPKAYLLWAEGRTDEARQYLKTESGVHGYKDIALKRV